MRDNKHTWELEGFRLPLRKVFSLRTVRQGYRLPREAVQPSSLEVFMTQMDKALDSPVGSPS